MRIIPQGLLQNPSRQLVTAVLQRQSQRTLQQETCAGKLIKCIQEHLQALLGTSKKPLVEQLKQLSCAATLNSQAMTTFMQTVTEAVREVNPHATLKQIAQVAKELIRMKSGNWSKLCQQIDNQYGITFLDKHGSTLTLAATSLLLAGGIYTLIELIPSRFEYSSTSSSDTSSQSPALADSSWGWAASRITLLTVALGIQGLIWGSFYLSKPSLPLLHDCLFIQAAETPLRTFSDADKKRIKQLIYQIQYQRCSDNPNELPLPQVAWQMAIHHLKESYGLEPNRPLTYISSEPARTFNLTRELLLAVRQ